MKKFNEMNEKELLFELYEIEFKKSEIKNIFNSLLLELNEFKKSKNDELIIKKIDKKLIKLEKEFNEFLDIENQKELLIKSFMNKLKGAE